MMALKVLPITGPSSKRMASTTMATKTRISAYSTKPCPFSLPNSSNSHHLLSRNPTRSGRVTDPTAGRRPCTLCCRPVPCTVVQGTGQCPGHVPAGSEDILSHTTSKRCYATGQARGSRYKLAILPTIDVPPFGQGIAAPFAFCPWSLLTRGIVLSSAARQHRIALEGPGIEIGKVTWQPMSRNTSPAERPT
jgi:hypothetical protein